MNCELWILPDIQAVMLTHVSISWRYKEHIEQEILKRVQDDGNKFRMTGSSSGWRKTQAVMLTHVSISWRNKEHIVQEFLKRVQDDGIKFRMTTVDRSILQNLRYQTIKQILPKRIEVINKFKLPLSSPMLQLLFPCNCLFYIQEIFKIDYFFTIVFFSKWERVFSLYMLINSYKQLRSDSNIQDIITAIC